MRQPAPLSYTLNNNIRVGLDNAFKQWAELLGPGARNQKPVQYFVGTIGEVNAFAVSYSFTEGRGQEFIDDPNNLHDALKNGTAIEWLPGAGSFMDEPKGKRVW